MPSAGCLNTEPLWQLAEQTAGQILQIDSKDKLQPNGNKKQRYERNTNSELLIRFTLKIRTVLVCLLSDGRCANYRKNTLSTQTNIVRLNNVVTSHSFTGHQVHDRESQSHYLEKEKPQEINNDADTGCRTTLPSSLT